MVVDTFLRIAFWDQDARFHDRSISLNMRPSTTFNVDSESPKAGHWQTIKALGVYLWPKGQIELKIRVLIAVLFLVGAKILNVYVPFLLKTAIDHFSLKDGPLVLPLAVIVSYALARILVQTFGEIRDLVFAKVAQHAQRTIALNTFKHLHGLSLEFHLSRQTGGLSRVIERGTRGIQFVLNFMTFNILPTLLEIFLVTGILLYHFNYLYAAVVFATISIYIVMTLSITEWRLKYRKKNEQRRKLSEDSRY